MSDLIPISALQHYVFCPRQCALIHVEGLWAENRLTVEGTLLHRRAHGEETGPRGGGRATARGSTRAVRGLHLCSERLGLIGKADVVEFVGSEPGTPFPIEYKRGWPKKHDADLIQLAAQAMCLEEMLGLSEGRVHTGAIYYSRTKHRAEVTIDAPLRQRTQDVIGNVRAMIESGTTPRAKRERKCIRCSLVNLCLPEATGSSAFASRFITSVFGSIASGTADGIGP